MPPDRKAAPDASAFRRLVDRRVVEIPAIGPFALGQHPGVHQCSEHASTCGSSTPNRSAPQAGQSQRRVLEEVGLDSHTRFSISVHVSAVITSSSTRSCSIPRGKQAMCRSSPAAHGLRFEREVAGGPFPCWLCFQQPAGLACGGNENSGTGETAGTQVGERAVRLRQRVRVDVRAQRDLAGQGEKFSRVAAGQVRDRAKRPLLP